MQKPPSTTQPGVSVLDNNQGLPGMVNPAADIGTTSLQHMPQSNQDAKEKTLAMTNIKKTTPKSKIVLDERIIVQGGSIKTWSFHSPRIERAKVTLTSDGRPIDVDVDSWQGPDSTPYQMRLYTENGKERPIRLMMETPRTSNTIAVRNTGQMEFPVIADVEANLDEVPLAAKLVDAESSIIIQGGALRSYPFDANVDQVQVLLMTNGLPMHARIELLHGPNNIKQTFELYAENGSDRPFYAVMESPGTGNVVRIVNAGSMEFPIYAWVAPFESEQQQQ